jgi:hypothetical protein
MPNEAPSWYAMACLTIGNTAINFRNFEAAVVAKNHGLLENVQKHRGPVSIGKVSSATNSITALTETIMTIRSKAQLEGFLCSYKLLLESGIAEVE